MYNVNLKHALLKQFKVHAGNVLADGFQYRLSVTHSDAQQEIKSSVFVILLQQNY